MVVFNDMGKEELLRIAACLEEHFPHSMANAVVQAARERDLAHEEMHSQVEYLVAHGIASTVDGRRVIIGSATSSLRMRAALSRRESRPPSTPCPSSTAICIWRLAACWPRLSASPTRCAPRLRMR